MARCRDGLFLSGASLLSGRRYLNLRQPFHDNEEAEVAGLLHAQ
jgi:hypothetical protein